MSVALIYRHIMDDVIRNIKPEVAAEGLDESILNELQQLWESKIVQTGSLGTHQMPVSTETESYVPHTSSYTYETMLPGPYANTTYTPDHTPYQQVELSHMYMPQNYINTAEPRHHYAPAMAQNPSVSSQIAANALRTLNTSIDPASLGKPLQYIPPPSQFSAWNNAVNLPDPNSRPSSSASINNILRQHDGASDEEATQQTTDKWEQAKQIDALMLQQYRQTNKQIKKKKHPTIKQVDGGGDDDDEEEGGAAEASPKDDEELDSDLDDEDDTEPETENFILCQYEKVTRIKNKRKTNLKDGIMHLNGKDSLFHKATGEFDW